MLGSWSTTIDPIQLAEKGARLTGELPVKGMSRLVEVCRDDRGSVRIDLQFERGASDGLRVMHGTVAARISLICQRCMNPMPYALESRVRLFLVRPGEREDLVEAGEALSVERPVALAELVEDELLLEMPMVPLHAGAECPAIVAAPDERGNEERARPSPFAVLQRLKHTDR